MRDYFPGAGWGLWVKCCCVFGCDGDLINSVVMLIEVFSITWVLWIWFTVLWVVCLLLVYDGFGFGAALLAILGCLGVVIGCLCWS